MRGRVLDVVSLFLLALAIRLAVSTISPLPYNIDAYPLVRISNDLLAGGSMNYAGEAGLLQYNAKLPAVPALIASVSALTGLPALELVRWLFPAVASVAVVGIYVLTLRVCGSRLGAYAAGLLLAASGFFVTVSASVMKETVALPLVPLILLLFRERKDPRMRALLVPVLLILPLVHHLTTFVIGTTLVLWVVADSVRRVRAGRWSLGTTLLDLVAGPALTMPGLWYYAAVDLNHVDRVANANDAALFLSVLLLMALFTVILTLPMAKRSWGVLSTETRPWARLLDEKLLVIIGALLLLALSSRVAVFGGTSKTDPSLLIVAAVYAALVFVAFIGFNLVRTTRSRSRSLVVAMVMAPLSIMGFGFLRGLDAFSLLLVYRTFTFLEFGIAVSLGVGVAYLAVRIKRVPWRVMVGTLLGACLVVSLAPAYDSLAFFGVQNETYPSELGALEFVSQHANGTVGTDQRLFDVGSPYFGIEGNGLLPRLLARGEDPAAYDYLLVQSGWTSIGAQEYPSGRITLSVGSFDALLAGGDVLYVTGPAWRETLLLRPRGS